MATAIHCDEPPGGFIDGVADGEQSVILKDDSLAVPEAGRDAISFRCFGDYMSGDTLVKPVPGEEVERRGKALLAMLTLLRWCSECSRGSHRDALPDDGR